MQKLKSIFLRVGSEDVDWVHELPLLANMSQAFLPLVEQYAINESPVMDGFKAEDAGWSLESLPPQKALKDVVARLENQIRIVEALCGGKSHSFLLHAAQFSNTFEKTDSKLSELVRQTQIMRQRVLCQRRAVLQETHEQKVLKRLSKLRDYHSKLVEAKNAFDLSEEGKAAELSVNFGNVARILDKRREKFYRSKRDSILNEILCELLAENFSSKMFSEALKLKQERDPWLWKEVKLSGLVEEMLLSTLKSENYSDRKAFSVFYRSWTAVDNETHKQSLLALLINCLSALEVEKKHQAVNNLLVRCYHSFPSTQSLITSFTQQFFLEESKAAMLRLRGVLSHPSPEYKSEADEAFYSFVRAFTKEHQYIEKLRLQLQLRYPSISLTNELSKFPSFLLFSPFNAQETEKNGCGGTLPCNEPAGLTYSFLGALRSELIQLASLRTESTLAHSLMAASVLCFLFQMHRVVSGCSVDEFTENVLKGFAEPRELPIKLIELGELSSTADRLTDEESHEALRRISAANVRRMISFVTDFQNQSSAWLPPPITKLIVGEWINKFYGLLRASSSLESPEKASLISLIPGATVIATSKDE